MNGGLYSKVEQHVTIRRSDFMIYVFPLFRMYAVQQFVIEYYQLASEEICITIVQSIVASVNVELLHNYFISFADYV